MSMMMMIVGSQPKRQSQLENLGPSLLRSRLSGPLSSQLVSRLSSPLRLLLVSHLSSPLSSQLASRLSSPLRLLLLSHLSSPLRLLLVSHLSSPLSTLLPVPLRRTDVLSLSPTESKSMVATFFQKMVMLFATTAAWGFSWCTLPIRAQWLAACPTLELLAETSFLLATLQNLTDATMATAVFVLPMRGRYSLADGSCAFLHPVLPVVCILTSLTPNSLSRTILNSASS
jgi:hypothetical protein